MFPIAYTYEKEKFADILRHVAEEQRRMDPMMTMPSPRLDRLPKTILAALLLLVSFIFG